MEAQSGMTFVAPLKTGLDDGAIEARREKVRKIRPASGELSNNIHFFSACIIFLEDPESKERKYFTVMEVSFDGSEDDMIEQLCNCDSLNQKVDIIFGDCQDYPGSAEPAKRKAFLENWQKKQALFFVGSKDLTVKKIRLQKEVYQAAKSAYANLFSGTDEAPTSKLQAWQTLRETLKNEKHVRPEGSASQSIGKTIDESAHASFMLKNNIANPAVRNQASHFTRYCAMAGLYLFTAIYLFYSIVGVLPVVDYHLYFALTMALFYVIAGVIFIAREFPRNIDNQHKVPLLLYETLVLVLQGAVVYSLLLYMFNLHTMASKDLIEVLYHVLTLFLFLAPLFVFMLILRFAAGRPGLFLGMLLHCLMWWVMHELAFGWFSIFCFVTVLELIVLAMAVLGWRSNGAFPLRYGILTILVHLAVWLVLGKLLTVSYFAIGFYALLTEAIFLAIGSFYVFYKIVCREFNDSRGGIDQPENRPDPVINAGGSFAENICFDVQNHMASVTRVKSGPFSAWLMLAVLKLINLLGYFSIRRSQGETSVIHYLRFVILEEGDYKYLLFLSNFDGTWHNYLGEFTVWALNAIWGNTGGYPPTQSLIFGGAANEQEFKRYAANSQVETLTWYSAYNDVTLKEVYAAKFICQYLRYPRKRFSFLPSEFHVKESDFHKNNNVFGKKIFHLREDVLEEATIRCNR